MILWLNPYSGISGDMLLGALVDLGAPLDVVRAAVASTGLTNWSLTADQVSRAGMRGCHVQVHVDDDVPERRAGELLALVASAQPPSVAQAAAAAITLLAEVESGIHGVGVDQVHLHELGGVDTVVDIVGTLAALAALEVTAVVSAPLGLGAGTGRAAHGQIPVPAPATLALLAGAQVTGVEAGGETVTPTGAVLLRVTGCTYGPPPAMTITATGYGAGTRDVPGRPNLLPAVLGTASSGAVPSGAVGGDVVTMTVVETTVDDVTGEIMGELAGLLLTDGAVDAWLTPVLGKKGRPAYVVTALCSPERADTVRARMLRETGSLGARCHDVQRYALPRQSSEVWLAGQRIRMKTGPHRSKPEHDDIAAMSARTGRPMQDLEQWAVAEHRSHSQPDEAAPPPGSG